MLPKMTTENQYQFFICVVDDNQKLKTLEQIEEEIFDLYIDFCGNFSRTSSAMGISRSTFYRKMNQIKKNLTGEKK